MKTLNRPKEVTISTSTVEGVEATDDFDTWFADMMATIEADFQESMETQARINNGYARRKELREKCRALTEPLREDTNGTGAGHLITGIAIEELKEQFGNKLTADRSFPNTDYMFLHELCKSMATILKSPSCQSLCSVCLLRTVRTLRELF